MRSLLKRWWFWVGAVGLAVIVLAGVVATCIAITATQGDFSKIQVGMTKEEVDKLIGDKQIRTNDFGNMGVISFYKKGPRLLNGPEMLALGFAKGSEIKVVTCHHNKFTDERTLWQRAQDEYRYQRRRLGW
jgi:hypothetical protein